MTDKQIIIDGCDVQNCVFFKYCDTDVEFSECLAHWHPNEDYSNVYYAQCDAYPNCYYKQLLRKEQECEELKKQLAEIILQSALLPKFFGLTADEITNMLNQLDQLKAENKHLNDLLNQALKELEKTRETLTEIKEIATENSLAQVGYNPDWDIILQKISEVEDE
jgi:hypothetical protein